MLHTTVVLEKHRVERVYQKGRDEKYVERTVHFFGHNHITENLYALNVNIISPMVLGKKYVEKGHGGFVSWEEFRKLVDDFALINTRVANIGDLIPWLDFLDLQSYIKRTKDFSAKFDRFLEHVLKEHEERRKGVENYVAQDMVDALLKLAEDPTLEVKLQRHNVKALTQVYLGELNQTEIED